jgi:hypothetical protein
VILANEMCQDLDVLAVAKSSRHTRWYVEHFRNRPGRKRLVQIVVENRSPWIQINHPSDGAVRATLGR